MSADASTTLNAGPFVGIVGGLLMVVSAVGLAGCAGAAGLGVVLGSGVDIRDRA